MKFEIKQHDEYGYSKDTWNLAFNDEIIVEKKSKERIIEIIQKVMEALL